jgi:hypothetical protein
VQSESKSSASVTLQLNPSNFAHIFAVIGSDIGTVNQEKFVPCQLPTVCSCSLIVSYTCYSTSENTLLETLLYSLIDNGVPEQSILETELVATAWK